jgi:hypothetical protein
MLYKFKSKATSDLIMLGPDGQRLLMIIRQDDASKGILTAAQLPQAIEALESAIASEEVNMADAHLAHKKAISSQEGTTPARDLETISLKRRAQPLLVMLRKSLSARADVVWGV